MSVKHSNAKVCTLLVWMTGSYIVMQRYTVVKVFSPVLKLDKIFNFSDTVASEGQRGSYYKSESHSFPFSVAIK